MLKHLPALGGDQQGEGGPQPASPPMRGVAARGRSVVIAARGAAVLRAGGPTDSSAGAAQQTENGQRSGDC